MTALNPTQQTQQGVIFLPFPTRTGKQAKSQFIKRFTQFKTVMKGVFKHFQTTDGFTPNSLVLSMLSGATQAKALQGVILILVKDPIFKAVLNHKPNTIPNFQGYADFYKQSLKDFEILEKELQNALADFEQTFPNYEKAIGTLSPFGNDNSLLYAIEQLGITKKTYTLAKTKGFYPYNYSDTEINATYPHKFTTPLEWFTTVADFRERFNRALFSYTDRVFRFLNKFCDEIISYMYDAERAGVKFEPTFGFMLKRCKIGDDTIFTPYGWFNLELFADLTAIAKHLHESGKDKPTQFTTEIVNTLARNHYLCNASKEKIIKYLELIATFDDTAICEFVSKIGNRSDIKTYSSTHKTAIAHYNIFVRSREFLELLSKRFGVKIDSSDLVNAYLSVTTESSHGCFSKNLKDNLRHSYRTLDDDLTAKCFYLIEQYYNNGGVLPNPIQSYR